MMKNILLINLGEEKIKIFIDLFFELDEEKYYFYLLTSDEILIKRFQEKKWSAKKMNLWNFENNNFYLFILLSPFLGCKFLIKLINYKFNKKIITIVLFNWIEKILATPIAKIFGLKIIWVEQPNYKYKELKLKKIYKLLSNFATLIVFNNDNKTQFKNFGFKGKNIQFINPAIKLDQYQENIFSKIAQSNRRNVHHKYFTIGVIIDFKQKHKIENLFQAIKICLSVISNLQLIVIGDGSEKKNLNWLAKKMEIDSLIWFIGEQNQIKKWLDNFDVYVAIAEAPNLGDYYNILEAMFANLPIIGPIHFGLEEIILENKTGSLIDINNSEMLANQIIKLYENKKLREQLGANGRERVQQFFTINKIIDKFESII